MSQKTTPALLIRRSNISPLRWTVQYRDKELYFESFRDAMLFCRGDFRDQQQHEKSRSDLRMSYLKARTYLHLISRFHVRDSAPLSEGESCRDHDRPSPPGRTVFVYSRKIQETI